MIDLCNGLWGDLSEHGVRFACQNTDAEMIASGTEPGPDQGPGCIAGATKWLHENGG